MPSFIVQGSDLTNVSTEVFKAKSAAKLAELAVQSRASIASEIGRIHQEN